MSNSDNSLVVTVAISSIWQLTAWFRDVGMSELPNKYLTLGQGLWCCRNAAVQKHPLASSTVRRHISNTDTQIF